VLEPDFSKKYFEVNIVFYEKTKYIPLGYKITKIAPPQISKENGLFEPTALDFRKDGTLVVGTRTAGVWLYKNNKWKQYAKGLYDVLGVKVAENGRDIYAIQKPELTLLIDEDGDDEADFYKTVSYQWKFTGNYHEYAFGPVRDKQGNFYITTNLSSPGMNRAVPMPVNQMSTPLGYRGWVLKIAPDGKTTPFASGFRSPAGIGINDKDEVFVTENQGDWVGSSYLIHVTKNVFHGHPASLYDTEKFGRVPSLNYKNLDKVEVINKSLKPEAFSKIRKLPTVWLPHNDLTGSPGNPEFLNHDKFGPFKGQIFLADYSKQSIVRIVLDKVNGKYQGAAFNFIRPLMSGGFRVKFGPDGKLYVGSLSRGWNVGSGAGLEVVEWTGEMPYEIYDIKLTEEGFKISFTKPLGPKVSAADFKVSCWNYKYWSTYGSQRQNEEAFKVILTEVSKDRKTVFIKVPLITNRIYRIQADKPSKDGDKLVNNTGFYTLNYKLK